MIENSRISWYKWVTESICVKEFKFVFDGYELINPSHWHLSFDVVAHAFCACISSKVKGLLFLECQSRSAHVWIVGSCGYCPSIVNLSFP